MVSRNYSAVLVNAALGTNLTQLDMVSVSSQEDIGLIQAVGGWNSLVGSTGKQVASSSACCSCMMDGAPCRRSLEANFVMVSPLGCLGEGTL